MMAIFNFTGTFSGKISGIMVLALMCSSPLFSQMVFPVKFANQADVKVYEVKFETQADLNVFRVDFRNQATDCNGLWFYTDFVNQAQWKIFFTDFYTQADLKIFYVKFRNQAGWRNEEKKQLYCNKTQKL